MHLILLSWRFSSYRFLLLVFFLWIYSYLYTSLCRHVYVIYRSLKFSFLFDKYKIQSHTFDINIFKTLETIKYADWDLMLILIILTKLSSFLLPLLSPSPTVSLLLFAQFPTLSLSLFCSGSRWGKDSVVLTSSEAFFF